MSSGLIKRLASVVLVLAAAVAAILLNDIVLGLDLRGGVTMRYELQPPDTMVEGTDTDSLIDATIETLRQRIDAFGIRENSISRQGERELVIELPGKGKEEAETIKSVISRVGRLEFRIVATDDPRNGLLIEDERARLAEVLAASIGRGPDEIDVTGLDRRFPDVLYRWVPYSDKMLAESRGVASVGDSLGNQPLFEARPLSTDDYLLIRKDFAATRTFTGADIAHAGPGSDSRGGRAVSVSLRPDRSSLFGDFTEEFTERQMAIVLDDRLASPPPRINDRLERSFVIEGGGAAGFSDREIKDYLTVIRSGSLQMKPRLLYENSIGPSLGESSIRSGTQAALLGLLITVVFMLFYYRWHGVHTAITLLANITVLTGLLMLLGATVTLPGIAGLVLTFGMAVDANILIYERMREEKDRAKSAAQVVKLGFEKALSTIVDSNVTTFITALILYKLGTGPVRGFAVVLMLGLVTSVWAALVVGRALYEYVLESGRMKSVGSMLRFVKPDAAYRFMAAGPLCLRISAIAVVASLVAFFATDRDKFGLDFVGGYKAQVRLERPATQGEVKSAVDRSFPGAQVVSVGGEAQGSRQYLIKIKAEPEALAAGDAASLQERYEEPLKVSLAGLILPDFVEDLTLVEDPEAQITRVSGTLNFDGAVDPQSIARHVGVLTGATFEAAGPQAAGFQGTIMGLGHTPETFVQRLKTALDKAGDLPNPTEPLLESTTIGARVGTELRDSAIRAILFSFAAIILYIRLRFRDYSYGLAAVIALLHDVCITLGIVTIVHQLGLVEIEIDLAMVAAFLTIVGYSLNDTIVLFDRVRENIPRLDRPLPEIIDVSMNQVLARTLLTSITVLLTLGIIFALNYGQQNMLEGFAFAMIVGVLVGTYSSIFVASPTLVWLSNRKARSAA